MAYIKGRRKRVPMSRFGSTMSKRHSSRIRRRKPCNRCRFK